MPEFWKSFFSPDAHGSGGKPKNEPESKTERCRSESEINERLRVFCEQKIRSRETYKNMVRELEWLKGGGDPMIRHGAYTDWTDGDLKALLQEIYQLDPHIRPKLPHTES